jgi:hypothetical protein
MKRLLIAITALTVSACSITKATYVPTLSVQASPKESCLVQLFGEQPKRAALQLGVVKVEGNVYSDFDDLVERGKKQAGLLGGDYLLLEDKGQEEKTIYSPGYTTFQASAQSNYCQSGESASSYSVGPSQETILLPWAQFSVWKFQAAHLGLRLDNNRIVGFHLNSNGPAAGLQAGDQLIGVDQYDIDDDGLTAHLLQIQPGDPVTLTVDRNGKRVTASILALRN